MKPEKVVIIGSGCAGWTAAIHAARANLSPLLITGAQAGGLLTTTMVVENFPGFGKGIDGNELMLSMQGQAKRFGTRVHYLSHVEKVDFSQRPFRLMVDGETIEALFVIVSTGSGHRHLGVPGEKELENRGVTFCATCDGALPVFRNKPLAVIGGGDSACEEANYLTRFGSEVFLVHRRDQLRASKIMVERVLANPKIKPIWNTSVEEVLGMDKGVVTGLRLRDVVTGKKQVLTAPGYSSPSATHPTPSSSPVNSTWMTPVTFNFTRAAKPTFQACLAPATAPITSTARPSPRRAWAAWPPSTPNGYLSFLNN